MNNTGLIKGIHNAIDIIPVTANKLNALLKSVTKAERNWAEVNQFKANSGQLLMHANEKGQVSSVWLGVEDAQDFWVFGLCPSRLPEGKYWISDQFNLFHDSKLPYIAWGLGHYQFDEFKSVPSYQAQLTVDASQSFEELVAMIEAIYLVRDLINQPANTLGPEELVEAGKKLAKAHGAKTKIISGKALVKNDFPMVYAVGKASPREPHLFDMTWGDKKHPKVTLVGKGVCFDTGGVDLKPASAMLLMQKDMGGAAHVLGLAQYIMTRKLPIQLRVIVPAVENAIGGNAYRPGDILSSRKGDSVEIINTDAEGRLILADALTLACEDEPDYLLDFATLTGACRVALGTDIPALFTRSDKLAKALSKASCQEIDPLWRLPLANQYRSMLQSHSADIKHCSDSGYAGGITAALFLAHFVPESTSWAHFDLMGWNTASRAGRPKGGEAMAFRAVANWLAGIGESEV